jgi:hypothetical protein
MPSILISEEGFIALPNIVFTAMLVVFYYAFYICHVKAWRSSRSFHGPTTQQNSPGRYWYRTHPAVQRGRMQPRREAFLPLTQGFYSQHAIRLRGKFSSKIVLLATYMYSTVILFGLLSDFFMTSSENDTSLSKLRSDFCTNFHAYCFLKVLHM